MYQDGWVVDELAAAWVVVDDVVDDVVDAVVPELPGSGKHLMVIVPPPSITATASDPLHGGSLLLGIGRV
jgi:hypothetical protein